jgi:hypothetical protein
MPILSYILYRMSLGKSNMVVQCPTCKSRASTHNRRQPSWGDRKYNRLDKGLDKGSGGNFEVKILGNWITSLSIMNLHLLVCLVVIELLPASTPPFLRWPMLPLSRSRVELVLLAWGLSSCWRYKRLPIWLLVSQSFLSQQHPNPTRSLSLPSPFPQYILPLSPTPS